MPAYDIFLKNEHPDWAARWMIKNNSKLLAYLKHTYFRKKNKVRVLEVGPGKGYFKEAVLRGGGYEYYAVDRNVNILKNLHLDASHTKTAQMPYIDFAIKFDLIFVGYVIEHLSDGMELYHAIGNLKSMLKDHGILVLQFPDAMKLGMEFYNIDYTHKFPTTKRNVNQAVLDHSMHVEKAIDLCGILYTKKVDSKVRYCIKAGVMHFYSYRFMVWLAKMVYRVPVWELHNVFWRAYGLLKEPNVMFVVKKD